MNSCELVTSITAIAVTMSKQYSSEELTLLSSAFMQLGDTLTTIVAHDELCKSNRNNEEDP